MVLTVAAMADVMEGRLTSGDPAQVVEGLSIDTRTLAPGELFIAIRGEHFDGHAFVAAAVERGAIGAVVSDASALPQTGGREPIVVVVGDTVQALQQLARHVRRLSGTRVIAITGSAGKTTTKEIAAEFLGIRYRVFRNKGNLNNHIGLPLSLLELRDEPEVAVVELGMNHPGEIRTLVHIAEPDVRVWTNVGDAHLGFFPSADAIADAKAEILVGASASSVLVANADDQRVMSRARAFAGRIVTFAMTADADVRATDIRELGLDGTEAMVQTARGRVPLRTPLLGLGNLANILAAIAVALQFQVPLSAVAERAATLRPAAHRGEVLRLAGGVVVIDDAYNSSPSALRRALETLAHTRAARKIAVLGEMLELGEHAARLHDECGRAAAASGLDALITVGGAPARVMADAARRAGMAPHSVQYVSTSDEAAAIAQALVRSDDLVLVKGSRGIRTDRVVARLKAERR